MDRGHGLGLGRSAWRVHAAPDAKLHSDDVCNARTSKLRIALFQCDDGSDEFLGRARRARSFSSRIAEQAAVFSLHQGAVEFE